ncbi:MAG: WS/DGAT domain-containing protein [Acidobacteriota bacterium]
MSQSTSKAAPSSAASPSAAGPSGPNPSTATAFAASQPRRWTMRPQDGMWLQDTPQNLMVVNSVTTLDQIDLETLRRLWDERVMQLEGGNRFPRFRWRVAQDERGVFWQEALDFDLANHVVESPEANAIDTKEKLQDYVGALASKPLARELPLWRLELIPEFVEGISAIVFRIHHCMGDGIALIPLLFSLMDRDNPAIDEFANPSVEVGAGKSGRSKLAVNTLAALAGGPVLLGKALALPDNSSLHGPECGGEKKVAWTDPIDLALIKRAKNGFGATVNDVLMACIAGGFQRYAEAHDGEALSRLRVSMPVNVRWPTEPLTMENRFATVLLKLPASESDLKERVLATKQRMDRLKRSVEPIVMFGAQNLLLYTLPSKIGRRLVDFFGNKTTCVLTNVPGPQFPLFVDGRRVRGMIFWVPQRGKIGIGVSVLSFAGTVRVGVIADTVLVPNPSELVAAFEQELQDLQRRLDG